MPQTEYRRLTSTAALNGDLDRPDVGQVFELGRVRGPWGIESSLHHARGEDRCRVRKGQGAQAVAATRSAAVRLLSTATASSRAAATRRFAAHPGEALALLLP